jgi:predicted Zn finger-like uncharacterized protein
MNSTGITRCPQCQTSFRVTDDQLRMADGAVRCGSCLTIFQAEAYMEDVPHHLQEETQSEPPTNWADNGEIHAGVTTEELEEVAPKVSTEVPTEVADSILDEVIYLGYDKSLVLESAQDGVAITAYWEAFELYAAYLQPPVDPSEQHWQGPPELVDPDLLVGDYEPHTGLSLYWFAGAMVLIVFSVLQYLYFNFDRYATDIRYRQYALEICQSLGCEVSDYSNACDSYSSQCQWCADSRRNRAKYRYFQTAFSRYDLTLCESARNACCRTDIWPRRLPCRRVQRAAIHTG